MEHPVIYSPGRTGMSAIAEINRLRSTLGNSSARIVVLDIGKSGSGLCDKCKPFMAVLDDFAFFPPASESPDNY
ncbi:MULTISPECIES: hypothetical protein [Acidithiobacillus]|uniref:hypothetical protein n=1 Tax=Acidithiobacillus ferrivorans TaxID=160808 RepID=UPI001C07C786|nr:hypothetical protein [Acidithiobacillus ferrivorans]MBU2851166.1 hypothetical protein [Acidithiobacillus ferrivorans]